MYAGKKVLGAFEDKLTNGCTKDFTRTIKK
jgi:hypothetical protein